MVKPRRFLAHFRRLTPYRHVANTPVIIAADEVAATGPPPPMEHGPTSTAHQNANAYYFLCVRISGSTAPAAGPYPARAGPLPGLGLPVCDSGPTHRWAPSTTRSSLVCLLFSIPFRRSPLHCQSATAIAARPSSLFTTPPILASPRRSPRTGGSDSCPGAAASSRFGASIYNIPCLPWWCAVVSV